MFGPNFYISWELIATEHIIWSNGIETKIKLNLKGWMGGWRGWLRAGSALDDKRPKLVNSGAGEWSTQRWNPTRKRLKLPPILKHPLLIAELTIPPAVKLRILEEYSLIVSCKVTILRWNQKLRFPICQVFSSVFEKKVVGARYRHQLPPTLVYSI